MVVVARHLLNPRRGIVDAQWLANYSPTRYRPMERLLASEEFEFLRASEGWTPAVEQAFRDGRRRLYRRYLGLIARDFDRLHTAARVLALHSPVDRPDLGLVLMREQVSFRKAMLTARFRLALHGLGMNPGDVRGLVRSVESMNSHVRALAAPAAA
jgi:hypothetical protein